VALAGRVAREHAGNATEQAAGEALGPLRRSAEVLAQGGCSSVQGQVRSRHPGALVLSECLTVRGLFILLKDFSYFRFCNAFRKRCRDSPGQVCCPLKEPRTRTPQRRMACWSDPGKEPYPATASLRRAVGSDAEPLGFFLVP